MTFDIQNMSTPAIYDQHQLLSQSQFTGLCDLWNDFTNKLGPWNFCNVSIVISDDTPSLYIPQAEKDLRELREELEKDISNERREAVCKVIKKIEDDIKIYGGCLGMYFPAEKKVELYYRNIDRSYPSDLDDALLYVFIHEMYHAYYDMCSFHSKSSSDLVPEIEEPLAEFGALRYFYRHRTYSNIYRLARNSVEEMKNLRYLSYYGFGAFVFDASYKNIQHFDIIDKYLSAKRKIKEADSKVKHFRSGFCNGYPFYFEDYYYELLLYILDPTCTVPAKRNIHIPKLPLLPPNVDVPGIPPCSDLNYVVYYLLDVFLSNNNQDYVSLARLYDNYNKKFGKYHIFLSSLEAEARGVAGHYLPKELNCHGYGILVSSHWNDIKDGKFVLFDEFIKQYKSLEGKGYNILKISYDEGGVF